MKKTILFSLLIIIVIIIVFSGCTQNSFKDIENKDNILGFKQEIKNLKIQLNKQKEENKKIREQLTLKDINDGYKKNSIGVFYKIQDEQDFEYIKDGYAKSKNSIYYKGMPVNFIALDNLGGTRHIDINSFRVLEDGYAKDNFHVFYKGILIMEADSKTFGLIDNFGGQFSGDRYAQDDKHVYFNGNLIENIESSNFKLLGEGYGKDNKFVIYRGKKIPNADIKTFEVSVTDEYSDNIGGYAKDKNTAYDNGVPRKKNK